MKHQDLIRLLARADREGFAVPSFNFNDIWDLTAIIQAAEEEKAPVMVQAIPRVMHALGLETGCAMALAAIRQASVPVILHVDHSNDMDFCKKAVDAGFMSVMIDASALSLEENIRQVKEVTDYAHAAGVYVEAEIGRIRGNDVEGVYEGEDYLARVEDAVKLCSETGVDLLAVGIGTAHGFYKGKPKLHFDRLEQLHSALEIPLVLHGGTGIPEEDLHTAIRNGINKINIGTALRFAYISSLQEQLRDAKPTAHPLDIHAQARVRIKEEVKAAIRSVMADGRC